MLGLSTFGPPPVRRARLEHKLRSLVADDALLASEGLGAALTEDELVDALHDRGLCVFVPLCLPRARC
jgi:hypothetical protein